MPLMPEPFSFSMSYFLRETRREGKGECAFPLTAAVVAAPCAAGTAPGPQTCVIKKPSPAFITGGGTVGSCSSKSRGRNVKRKIKPAVALLSGGLTVNFGPAPPARPRGGELL